MTDVASTSIHEAPVEIPIGRTRLNADLAVPDEPLGLIVFAHGSGSGRKSPRNRAVAAALWQKRFATLLLDLLTENEERVDEITLGHRFDIPLLAERLVAAIDWAESTPTTWSLRIGLFGASTGAAAALVAAARRPSHVGAVVSRGGRPDLAGAALREVRAPTLLIVGGFDESVLDLNRQAMEQLTGVKRLEIVPRATHLFEEPGALEQVSALAGAWFANHLAAPAAGSPRTESVY
jgi:putative phosphoribosyl transferase